MNNFIFHSYFHELIIVFELVTDFEENKYLRSQKGFRFFEALFIIIKERFFQFIK